MTIDHAATHGSPQSGAQSGANSASGLAVGEILRARREELGWSLAEVAAWLRIKQAYLQALEDNRPQDLPGSTYALGFLRSYASGLGLDARQLGQRFRDEASLGVPRPDLSFPAPVPERGVPAGAAVLLGVVLLGAAYTGWYIYGGSEKLPTQTLPPAPPPLAESQTPTTPATTPARPVAPAPVSAAAAPPPVTSPPGQAASAVPAAPVPAASTPPGAGVPAPVDMVPAAAAPSVPAPQPAALTIKASAASWVQVRAPGGPVLYERILQPGESWSAPASGATLLLSTGNAGGITVSAGGITTPALGPPGAVRRNLPLNADAVRDGRLVGPALVAPTSGQTPPFLAGSGARQPPATPPARANADPSNPEQ